VSGSAFGHGGGISPLGNKNPDRWKDLPIQDRLRGGGPKPKEITAMPVALNTAAKGGKGSEGESEEFGIGKREEGG